MHWKKVTLYKEGGRLGVGLILVVAAATLFFKAN